MVDILHKVGIKSSSLNDVYKALTRWKVFPADWKEPLEFMHHCTTKWRFSC